MKFILAIQFMIVNLLFHTLAVSPIFPEEKSLHSDNATVTFSGGVAADGCGWLIKLDNNNEGVYSPLKLPAKYRKDSLKIYITYEILMTRFQCGPRPGNGPVQINIISIKKR